MTESLEFFQIGLMNSKKKTKRKQKIKELKETINTLTEKNKSLTSDGVQENENENTDYIVLKTMSEELDVEIAENDLDRAHRIDCTNRKDSKSQAIIFNLICYAVRDKKIRCIPIRKN